MNIEMAIRSALVMISQIHVLAGESPQMAKAMDLLSCCLKSIDKAKGEQADDHHNGQGKDL